MGVLFTRVMIAVLMLCAVVARGQVAAPVEIWMAPSPPKVERPEGSGARPSFAGRVVTRFDFEERDVNPEEVPANWFRAQHNPPERERLGFPAFNRAHFDHTQGASGQSSVMLPTRGGSTSLRLAAGTLVVFADAEYRVSAMVKTKGLTRARAVLQSTLLDANRQVLPGSTTHAAPVVSDGAWTPVSLSVPSGFAGAAFLQIELLLLQPDQLPVPPEDRRRIWSLAPDLDGGAWFDDVTILQLPRVSISTGQPANTFFAPDMPVLSVDVRDLTGEQLTTELVVTDLYDQVVKRVSAVIPRGGSVAKVPLDLPAYGWFRVQMDLVGVSNVATKANKLAETTILWMPGTDPTGGTGVVSSLRPFALFGDRITTDAMPSMPRLVTRLGIPRLTAGLPTEVLPNAQPADIALGQLLDNLSANPLDFTLSLPQLPAVLADKLHAPQGNPLALGSMEPSLWMGELEALVGAASQRLSSWQIGPTISATPLDHDAIPGQLSGFRKALSRISPSPRLILPWSADSQWLETNREGRAFAGASIAVPASYPLAALKPMLDSFSGLPGDSLDVTFVVGTLSAEQFSRRDQLEHFLQTAITLWSETATLKREHPPVRIGAADPWTIGRDRRLRPEPILAALSTLAGVTDGMRVIGEVPASPGVRGIVLAPETGTAIGSLGLGSGTLIAWNESAAENAPTITGFFGGGTLTLIDPFGNRTPLAPEKNSGRHIIPVSTMPVYVTGIDPHLVQFLGELKVQPSFIPAVVANHDCELVLRNPWSTRISGDITLLNPDIRSTRRDQNWFLSPSTPIPFSIAPGQSVRLPFTFQFTSAEESGVKQLPMSVRLTADRPYPAMRLSKPINIGLEDLDLQVTAQLGPRDDGPEVILTATVSNTGKLTRTLQLSTNTSGFATQSQPVVDLGPGETAVRRFVFRNAAEALTGRRIRVLLVDIDGAERMTKYAPVP